MSLPGRHTHHPAAAAAAAAAAATATQKYLTAARSASQVTAVLFGSPNVGDATFADDFNSRVNTRNIEFHADMVTQVRPCNRGRRGVEQGFFWGGGYCASDLTATSTRAN
jgi:hypothetical protein